MKDYNIKFKSFLFYDYETFGVHTALDKVAQFSSIRTDLSFNIIHKKKNFFCIPPIDYLPDPNAILITKILPQDTYLNGMNEYFFAHKIHNIFIKSNTCIVGFNNLNFDNLVTRNIFYRNCFDPYEWSWKNGNSSWDILNILRAFYIFFPKNIFWPKNPEGHVSFKLSDFTKINNISHLNVHDSFSDVLATVKVAKLLCFYNKKFFFKLYCFSQKNNIKNFIRKNSTKPFFYLSSIFGAKRNNISCMMYLNDHPTNNNLLLLFDLQVDVKKIFLLYRQSNKFKCTIKDLLSAGIKIIYLNKSPMFFKYSSISEKECQRLKLDYIRFQKSFFLLFQHKYIKKWILSIFLNSTNRYPLVSDNIDLMLYHNFFNDKDKLLLNILHQESPKNWNIRNIKFLDARLYKIIFRLRARNFPDSLSLLEKKKWKKHCKKIINSKRIVKYFNMIFSLKILYNDDYKKLTLLNKLIKYVSQLLHNINSFC